MESLIALLQANSVEAMVGLGLLAVASWAFLKKSSSTLKVKDQLPQSSEQSESSAHDIEDPEKLDVVEEAKAEEPLVEAKKESDRSIFFRGLQKSRALISSSLTAIFGGKIDAEALEQLEELLIYADVGDLSFEIVERLGKASKQGEQDLKGVLKERLIDLLGEDEPLRPPSHSPHVILVVGVNGSGKTTTIGKLAHRYQKEGKRVMVAAGDTFRAGAAEQLKVWAERSGAAFVEGEENADPSSVVYRAIDKARSTGVDVLICDTAGRLQANQPLMDELRKMVRVIQKQLPEAPHEGLLVLDSTIGQNALFQAEGFGATVELSGVVLTKLDGTAKGGVVFSIRKRLGIPVKMVGLGEGIEDLRDFNGAAFVDALIEDSPIE